MIWCIEKINTEFVDIISYFDTVEDIHTKIDSKLIKKTDLEHFKFSKQSCIDVLKNFRKVRKDIILSFITHTYCKVCGLALIYGWIFGGGSIDMIINLERLGYHFGVLLKISNDFTNIEKDIENVCNGNYTFNYVINHGLQDAFELFDESKKKLFEGILTLGIASPTIKEIIKILDTNVLNVIEHSSPDLRQSISSTSSF
jgi:hypothetical protein